MVRLEAALLLPVNCKSDDVKEHHQNPLEMAPSKYKRQWVTAVYILQGLVLFGAISTRRMQRRTLLLGDVTKCPTR